VQIVKNKRRISCCVFSKEKLPHFNFYLKSFFLNFFYHISSWEGVEYACMYVCMYVGVKKKKLWPMKLLDLVV
jgi:hypothetical protein